jgi:hypothetical protein
VRSLTFPNLPSIFPVGTSVTYGLTYNTEWIANYVDHAGWSEWSFPGSTPLSEFNYWVTVGEHEYRWSQRGLFVLRRGANGLQIDTLLSGITMAGDPAGDSPAWYPEYFDVGITLPSNAPELPTEIPETLLPSGFVFALSDGVHCTLLPCGSEGYVTGTFTSARRIPTPATLTAGRPRSRGHGGMGAPRTRLTRRR